MEEELVGWRRREISVMPDLPEWALRPGLKTPGPGELPPGEHPTPSNSVLIALTSTSSAKVVSGVGCGEEKEPINSGPPK